MGTKADIGFCGILEGMVISGEAWLFRVGEGMVYGLRFPFDFGEGLVAVLLPFTAGAELLAGGRSFSVVTGTAAAGKRRLLLVLPLQLRKGVAEEHLLSLLQWEKKTPDAAATSCKVFPIEAIRYEQEWKSMPAEPG
ncbi:hypothetical protein D5086_008742 [Populus alba]|uniref:Uncharacterized protein n=1 Tax=Populus alba TaxID=43335 RepID=A0ACC4CHU5_POPAL